MRLPPTLRTGALAFTIAFSGAAAPGPMLALVIGQSIAGGVMATVFILLGHAALEAGVVGLLVLGLGRILARRGARAVLGITGGAVLAMMGMQLLNSLGEATLAAASEGRLSWYYLILAGMGVSVSNPYFTGWWATVGTGQIATLKLKQPRDYLAFWIGHEMGDVVWYIPIAILVTMGSHWLSDDLYRWVLAACGSIIVAMGCGFVLLGARAAMTARTTAR